jgi:hypothetical protein
MAHDEIHEGAKKDDAHFEVGGSKTMPLPPTREGEKDVQEDYADFIGWLAMILLGGWDLC